MDRLWTLLEKLLTPEVLSVWLGQGLLGLLTFLAAGTLAWWAGQGLEKLGLAGRWRIAAGMIATAAAVIISGVVALASGAHPAVFLAAILGGALAGAVARNVIKVIDASGDEAAEEIEGDD